MLSEKAKWVDRMVEENRLDEISEPDDRQLVMRTFAEHLPGVKIKAMVHRRLVDRYDYSAMSWDAAKEIVQNLSSRERTKRGVHPA